MKMLESLQKLDAQEALKQMVDIAKKAMAGADPEIQELALNELMKRVMPPGRGMGNRGRSSGGEATKAPDDGRDTGETKIKGQLDLEGDLGQRVPFKGIPRPEDAKKDFDATVGRAIDDAEQSLGRDELPPSTRPFVRRYFEELKKNADSGDSGSGDGDNEKK